MSGYFAGVILYLFLWIVSSRSFLIPFEELAKSYDSTIIPKPRGLLGSSIGPLRINVSLLINTLHVDDLRQAVQITGELQSEWDDLRLRYSSNSGPHAAIGLQGRRGNRIKDHLWLPDITVANGLQPAGSLEDFLRIEHDGHIIWTQQVQYEFPCKFDLRYYPMGEQKCTLCLQSIGYDTKQMEPHWENPEAVHYDEAVVSPTYRVLEIETTAVSVVAIHRAKRQLQATITLESQSSWSIKQTVLPFVAAVVTAYLAFFISISGFAARMMLCCTCFIVACIFHISTYNKTPQAPLTMVNFPLEEEWSSALEVYTGTCLTFIWIAIAETIIVHVLSRFDSRNVLATSHNSLPPEHAEMLGHVSPSRGEIAALWMDRGFRVLYPAIFLSFNAVYWIMYT